MTTSVERSPLCNLLVRNLVKSTILLFELQSVNILTIGHAKISLTIYSNRGIIDYSNN